MPSTLARSKDRQQQKGGSLYWLNKYKLPFLFLLPTAVLVIGFLGWPMLSIFYFSLRKTPLEGGSFFVGLNNFRLLLNEARFLGNLTTTLKYLIGNLGLSVPLAYLGAILVTRRPRSAGLFRSIFLLPWIIAPVVSAILFRTVVDPRLGPVALVAKWLTGDDVLFLVNPNLAMLTIVLHSAWRSFPLEMLLISAGIASIQQELYDAAEVDGAGAWDRFRHITFPLTRPSLVTAMLVITIWTLQDAEGAYSLTFGGPGYATEVAGVRLFKEAFIYFNLGIASAIGSALILFSVLFMAFYMRGLGMGEEI